MSPAGTGPLLGAGLVTSISGSDCGRRKIYSCEFQSAHLAFLPSFHKLSIIVQPGSFLVSGRRLVSERYSKFLLSALCRRSLTRQLGQGQSRAVLPRLGPCQQLRPPRARCVTKYSQIAAGSRGAWTVDMSHGPLSKMPECLDGSRHNGTALVWHILWYVADFGVCHMELVVASFS